MDLPDFEAHADYWKRQVELHPDDQEILDMRTLAVAEYIVQIEAIVYFSDQLE